MKYKIAKIRSHISAHAYKHQQKIRFFIVGGWNTLFGYLVFFFFDSVISKLFGPGPHSYMVAIVLANVLAMIMAYTLHRVVTFRSDSRGTTQVKEFIKFLLGNITTMGISVVLLPVIVEVAGFNPKVAALFVTAFCALFNYFAHSRITFRSLKNKEI